MPSDSPVSGPETTGCSVLQRYNLQETVGAGGLGETFKAYDTRLGRTVAIKRLHYSEEISHCLESLEAEARALATINHPNIATIYELERDEKTAWIIMEFVEGKTLRQVLDEGPLEVAKAIDIALQVAGALTEIHKRGLIHGDLKPANVMINTQGLVKVLDFGLARQLKEVMTSGQPSEFSGTLACVSPEQARGGVPNAGSDLFSLGALLYEMLAGRTSFTGNDAKSIVHSVLSDSPTPLSLLGREAPLELEDFVHWLLQKDPSQRCPSAEIASYNLTRLRETLSGRTSQHGLSPQDAAFARDRDGNPISSTVVARSWACFITAKCHAHRKGLRAASTLFMTAVCVNVAFNHPVRGHLFIDLILAAAAVGVFLLCKLRIPTLQREDLAQIRRLAFRGLLPFHETDQAFFFGRELDTLGLFERVVAEGFRFGVLFGDSGCGKTSLLRAGLMPRLRRDGIVPLYVRLGQDPIEAVLSACRQQAMLSVVPGEVALSCLHRTCRTLGADLVLIFDQFEQFFSSFKTTEEREPMVQLVTACVLDSSLPVRFLFSIRSDFLYLISITFEGKIQEPLLGTRLYHLRSFDCRQAEEIMDKSAARAGLLLERGLITRVTTDLAGEGGIQPSELQIVGEQLQSRRLLTLDAYLAAGGQERLVHSYLEEVVEASPDPATSRLLLRSLISDENMRLALTVDELCLSTQRNRQLIGRLLAWFSHARLIREVLEEVQGKYELTHDYLIAKVHQVSGIIDATWRANSLFRQYRFRFELDKRTRIPLRECLFIRRYCRNIRSPAMCVNSKTLFIGS